MALLDIKTRQTYLKDLGFYSGEVDGIVGSKTKQAYSKLQNKYFTRKKDKDGIYGTNTDILLRNAYICKDLKNFKLPEFKCKCKGKYCTGYPAVLDSDLILYMSDIRNIYNTAMTIESGLRCEKHNASVGGTKGSRHNNGKAIDFTMKKYTKTLSSRIEIINHFIRNYKESRYAYCNGYVNSNGKISYKECKSMENSIHIDVK